MRRTIAGGNEGSEECLHANSLNPWMTLDVVEPSTSKQLNSLFSHKLTCAYISSAFTSTSFPPSHSRVVLLVCTAFVGHLTSMERL